MHTWLAETRRTVSGARGVRISGDLAEPATTSPRGDQIPGAFVLHAVVRERLDGKTVPLGLPMCVGGQFRGMTSVRVSVLLSVLILAAATLAGCGPSRYDYDYDYEDRDRADRSGSREGRAATSRRQEARRKSTRSQARRASDRRVAANPGASKTVASSAPVSRHQATRETAPAEVVARAPEREAPAKVSEPAKPAVVAAPAVAASASSPASGATVAAAEPAVTAKADPQAGDKSTSGPAEPRSAAAATAKVEVDEAARETARKQIDDGYRLLRAGFVKKARERFERAMAGNAADASLGQGRSMDPSYLKTVAFPDVIPDADQARRLYRRAILLGNDEAKADLDRLEKAMAAAAPTILPSAPDGDTPPARAQ